MAAGANRMVSLVIAPIREQHGGQQVHRGAGPPVGEQAAQHAGLGQRFGGVPAHADDQAEVGGEGEPPQGVTPGLAGEHAAEQRHGRHREQVERDQHDGHELVLAEETDPGQQRVADAGVPVGLVHRDAERGGVPVGRVQREPVVELPVVAREPGPAAARGGAEPGACRRGPAMMNRLRWPLAQICQRARAKPSQPRKAMTPGTSGRFNLDHSDDGLCRRDLSSSRRRRELQPQASTKGCLGVKGTFLPGARSLPERRHTL